MNLVGLCLEQAAIFHYGSISLIEEPCRSTQLAAMTIAKKSGSILSYDPNLRLPLWPSADAARKGIMSIWDQADIIKVNYKLYKIQLCQILSFLLVHTATSYFKIPSDMDVLCRT